MELPRGAKARSEKKLPPCPKCGGRLAYRISVGDNTLAGLIFCSAKSVCTYKTYPMRIFLKKVQGKTPEDEKKRENAAFRTMFYSLAQEVETSWQLKREQQKEEESNVRVFEESFQEKPKRTGVLKLSDEEPEYYRIDR